MNIKLLQRPYEEAIVLLNVSLFEENRSKKDGTGCATTCKCFPQIRIKELANDWWTQPRGRGEPRENVCLFLCVIVCMSYFWLYEDVTMNEIKRLIGGTGC